MAFIRERRFCQLEQEINREIEKRRVNREQEMMEVRTADTDCAVQGEWGRHVPGHV